MSITHRGDENQMTRQSTCYQPNYPKLTITDTRCIVDRTADALERDTEKGRRECRRQAGGRP